MELVSKAMQHIETIEENFNAVKFAQGKTELTYKAKSLLNDLVKYMKDNPDLRLKLEGRKALSTTTIGLRVNLALN